MNISTGPQHGIGGQANFVTSKHSAAVTLDFINYANGATGDVLVGEQIDYLIWKMRCLCELNQDSDFQPDTYEGIKGLTKLAGGISNQKYKEKALDSLIDALEKIRGNLEKGERLAGSLLEYASILLKNWSDILNIQPNNTSLHVKMITAIGDIADLFFRYLHYNKSTGSSVVGSVDSTFKADLQEMVSKFEGLYPSLSENLEVATAVEYTKSILIILKSNTNTVKEIAQKLNDLFQASANDKAYDEVGRKLFNLYDSLGGKEKVSNWFSKVFLLKLHAAKTIHNKIAFIPGTNTLNNYEISHYNSFSHHVNKSNRSWQVASIAINLLGKVILKTSSMVVARGLILSLKRLKEQIGIYKTHEQLYLEILITNQLIKISTQLSTLNNDIHANDFSLKTEKEIRIEARKMLIDIGFGYREKSATIAREFFLSLDLIDPEIRFSHAIGFDEKKKREWLNEEGRYTYTPKIDTTYTKPLKNPFENQLHHLTSSHQIVDWTILASTSKAPSNDIAPILEWFTNLPSLSETPAPVINPMINSLQFPLAPHRV